MDRDRSQPQGVRCVQQASDLPCAFECLLHRQGTFELLALDVLHHQIIRTDIINLADVGIIQRSDSLGFALESFAELGLGNLDGDAAGETRVTAPVHFSHAARADRRDDFIWAEYIAGG